MKAKINSFKTAYYPKGLYLLLYPRPYAASKHTTPGDYIYCHTLGLMQHQNKTRRSMTFTASVYLILLKKQILFLCLQTSYVTTWGSSELRSELTSFSNQNTAGNFATFRDEKA